MVTRSRIDRSCKRRGPRAMSRRLDTVARIAPVVLAAGTAAWMLYTNGAPAGYAGAPVDNRATCSACHAGGNGQGGVDTPFHVTTSAAEFTPGSPIEVTVTMDEPGQAYYTPGFQLTAASDGGLAGSFEILDQDHTQFAIPQGGGDADERYVTHRAPNEDTRSWTVLWQPGSAEGSVTFYAAGLSNYGGVVYRDSLVVPRRSSVEFEDELNERPQTTSLQANYPNPFSRETLIPFELNEPAVISLKVFDLTGRQIAVLASGRFPAGKHYHRFRADGIPSGFYVYRLSGTSGGYARTMLYIR